MRLVFLCALAAFPAAAATLDEVRLAVTRLEGKQPIRATLGIEQDVKSSGRYANDTTKRTATADLMHDAAGISITIPQALIARASEGSRSDEERNTAEDAIGAIRTLSVVEALNFRDSLLALLKGAKLEEEKRVVFRGRPARQLLLLLDATPRRERNTITIGSVKNDDRMSLWIGDDNIPVGAERDQKTSGGILFVRGTFTSHTSYSFARAGDRLVLSRLEITEGGSGMGQRVDKRSIQTVTVR